MPNIMMTDILAQFSIDVTTFGQFSGIYYIGYSLMHLPVGILLDRYGPKKVMPLCIIITVIGLLPILLSNYWVYPIVGRALIGMGSSAAILGTFKIIRLTFSEAKFTRMLSCSVTIGLIGAIYGGAPINYLCSVWGYKAVVGMLVGIGILLSIVTYFIIPEASGQYRSSVISDIKKVFGTPKVMAICFFSGLMVGPMEGFADAWGTEFLKRSYGLESGIAASLPSMIYIGMCFGGPLLSLISERTSVLGSIIGAAIIMALSFVVLLGGALSPHAITILFLMVGVCSAYQIIAIYKASTYVQEHLVGLTTAVANMIIMIFGYAFHSLIGKVVDFMGGMGNSEAFLYGVSIIPIGLIIGAGGFITIAFQEFFKRRRFLQVD
jgi:predicted MFS family arabinose efflux permease